MKRAKMLLLTVTLAFGLLVHVQAQVPPANGLAAYYPLHTGGLDESGNGFDLVCGNVVFTNFLGSDLAAAFNGTSSFAVVSNSFFVRQPNWTWAAWVYAPQPAVGDALYQALYAEGRQGGSCFGVGVYPQASVLEIGAWNNALPGNWMTVPVRAVLTNRWTHTVLTLSNGGVGTGTLSVFFNGILTTNAAFQSVAPQDVLQRMGVLGNGWMNSSEDFTEAPFRGGMNNLRIYSRALSASEVQQLYAFEATPVILSQPQAQSGYFGTSVSFTIQTGSPLPLSYQWSKDGFRVSTGTNSVLTLTNVDLTAGGYYSVVISNRAGSVTSNPALLVVTPLVQAKFTNVVTLTLSASLQNTTSDNAGVSSTLPPTQTALATKDILGLLAQDEFAAGKYSASSFPSGAKLIVDPTTERFQVTDKNLKVLVDVGNIMTNYYGTNTIQSGKVSDATGLASPTRNALAIVTVNFDDTGIAGGANLRFYVRGLVSASLTDSTPSPRTRIYTETQAYTSKDLAGEGSLRGTPFVITGTAATSGTTTGTL